MEMLIKNAHVVNADNQFDCHIMINNGVITQLLDSSVDVQLPPNSMGRIIDAKGYTIIPGGIDAHMHVQAPFQGMTGQLTFYQQSVCAAFGGVTTFMDFINTTKGKSIVESFHERKAEMTESVIDYGIHEKSIFVMVKFPLNSSNTE